MPDLSPFLLYGANGFTAGLIIDQAASFGLQPILAGRNEAKIKELAQQHGLPYRIADLADAGALDALLQDIKVVLHCAGPFSQTALPMQQACLRRQTHYLDITGEIAVFEQGAALHGEAVKRKVLLMSGVGFDVVPTDCMALFLQQKLPDATHLQLAFQTMGGKVSHGTAATAIENLGAGGMVRENGKLKRVPTAHKTLFVPFTANKQTTCIAIPWGDLSTAYHTTGIPDIETYMAAPPVTIRVAKLSNYLNWLIGSWWFKRLVRKRIDRTLTGPDDAARKAAQVFVWGRAWNNRGESVQARLRGPDGYSLTAAAALTITRKVLNGDWQPGFQTPAGLYGSNLVLELAGTQRQDIVEKD
ncbi:MAG TPA: saccharopine dehydrogenase NADP-binding domain-containing protein [Flavisolibacter sp.]|jgi:short subunit dehydrogenase-like uncharacterized protein|nr:saccharopine dehydrogenase NADP-binding domain-containing protein [Flavisolibacter sp.]